MGTPESRELSRVGSRQQSVEEQGYFKQNQHRSGNEEHREWIRRRESGTDDKSSEIEVATVGGEVLSLDKTSPEGDEGDEWDLESHNCAKAEPCDEADPCRELPGGGGTY